MILTVADARVWSGGVMILTVTDAGVWSSGVMVLTVAGVGVWSNGVMILTVAERCTRPQNSYGMTSDPTGNDRLAPDRFRHGKIICNRDGNGKILTYHIMSLILSPSNQN